MKKIQLFSGVIFLLMIAYNPVNAQYWSLSGNNATNSYKLGTRNSTHLKLYTNNFERLRITSSGNVGIGITNPSSYAKLHVYNNSGSGYGIWSYGRYLGVYGESNSSGSYGVYGNSRGSNGYGVYGYSTYGVWGKGKTCNDYGVVGEGGKYGVYGYSECDNSYGVYGSGTYYGLYGYTDGGSGSDPDYPSGVFGHNESSGYGVGGYCVDGSGVYGVSKNYIGVYGYTENSSYYAGYFDGDVYTTGSYLPSDRILKQNISDLTSAVDIIKKLHAKSYNFRQDGNYKLMKLPVGQHFGLISEDVEQVLPSLVKATRFDTRMVTAGAGGKQKIGAQSIKATPAQPSETIDFKAVNYTEFIPVLVAGMQEQQATIEKLEAKIEALTQLVNQLQKSNPELSVKLSGMSLGTAIPNPATGNTKITYTIPNNLSRAEMLISNAAGQNIRQMQLDKSGMINISTSNLASGTYTYSLVVSGKIVATNKFVVQR